MTKAKKRGHKAEAKQAWQQKHQKSQYGVLNLRNFPVPLRTALKVEAAKRSMTLEALCVWLLETDVEAMLRAETPTGLRSDGPRIGLQAAGTVAVGTKKFPIARGCAVGPLGSTEEIKAAAVAMAEGGTPGLPEPPEEATCNVGKSFEDFVAEAVQASIVDDLEAGRAIPEHLMRRSGCNPVDSSCYDVDAASFSDDVEGPKGILSVRLRDETKVFTGGVMQEPVIFNQPGKWPWDGFGEKPHLESPMLAKVREDSAMVGQRAMEMQLDDIEKIKEEGLATAFASGPPIRPGSIDWMRAKAEIDAIPLGTYPVEVSEPEWSPSRKLELDEDIRNLPSVTITSLVPIEEARKIAEQVRVSCNSDSPTHYAGGEGPHLLRDRKGNTAYCGGPGQCEFCEKGVPEVGDHQAVDVESIWMEFIHEAIPVQSEGTMIIGHDIDRELVGRIHERVFTDPRWAPTKMTEDQLKTTAEIAEGMRAVQEVIRRVDEQGAVSSVAGIDEVRRGIRVQEGDQESSKDGGGVLASGDRRAPSSGGDSQSNPDAPEATTKNQSFTVYSQEEANEMMEQVVLTINDELQKGATTHGEDTDGPAVGEAARGGSQEVVHQTSQAGDANPQTAQPSGEAVRGDDGASVQPASRTVAPEKKSKSAARPPALGKGLKELSAEAVPDPARGILASGVNVAIPDHTQDLIFLPTPAVPEEAFKILEAIRSGQEKMCGVELDLFKKKIKEAPGANGSQSKSEDNAGLDPVRSAGQGIPAASSERDAHGSHDSDRGRTRDEGGSVPVPATQTGTGDPAASTSVATTLPNSAGSQATKAAIPPTCRCKNVMRLKYDNVWRCGVCGREETV